MKFKELKTILADNIYQIELDLNEEEKHATYTLDLSNDSKAIFLNKVYDLSSVLDLLDVTHVFNYNNGFAINIEYSSIALVKLYSLANKLDKDVIYREYDNEN